MGKSSDQIRQEIERERQDAGQKIDQLERQVQQNAEHMKQQAQDTAQQVRGEAQGMVEDTVHTVKENVQNIDFQQQIQERPLVAAGAALLGGFLLGGMMGGGGGQQHQGSQQYSGAHTSGGGQQGGGQQGGGQGGGMTSSIRSAAKKSGLEDTIENAAAALLGSVTEQLKGTMNQRLPGYAEKMETAEQKGGSFSEKAKATQHEAQQRQ